MTKQKSPWLAALIVATSLTGCAGIGFDCPPLIEYGEADRDELLLELETMDDTSAVMRFLGDYLQLREMVRACRG